MLNFSRAFFFAFPLFHSLVRLAVENLENCLTFPKQRLTNRVRISRCSLPIFSGQWRQSGQCKGREMELNTCCSLAGMVNYFYTRSLRRKRRRPMSTAADIPRSWVSEQQPNFPIIDTVDAALVDAAATPFVKSARHWPDPRGKLSGFLIIRDASHCCHLSVGVGGGVYVLYGSLLSHVSLLWR